MTGDRLRLGIVTNEVLMPGVSRLGGFGYAASKVSDYFAARPELGVDPRILCCEPLASDGRGPVASNGVPVLHRAGRKRWDKALSGERINLLLSIDYRPTYDPLFSSLDRTPLIVWVQDPRSRDDADRIRSLRIPGGNGTLPTGIGYLRVRGLRRIAIRSFLQRRRIVFPFTSPDLARKFRSAYGLPRPLRVRVLPNIVEMPAHCPVKSRQPLVVFLGRLDPIKRPWIAVEVAKAMPDIRVALLGNNHFPEVFQLKDTPANLEVPGHVSGAEKARWLSEAWVLLNPSIHESLPVSFLEALAHEVPIVSSVNPGGLVSSYGIHVPMVDGDGLGSVEAFTAAIRLLVNEPSTAAHLGQSGREWVEAHSSPPAFLEAFAAVCRRLGVHLPAVAGGLAAGRRGEVRTDTAGVS